MLNDATAMLRYSHGLTEMMRDTMHEASAVDCRCASYALSAIAALTQMGLECMAQAHAQMTVEGVTPVDG
ncbi:hypothetical protein [Luteibacter sp.]|jgi:hypothetical protein|uniref:hypothetical protein n=1 Tax=Luteibacter sp. TaxID=1886636 RepID=UPI002F4143BE